MSNGASAPISSHGGSLVQIILLGTLFLWMRAKSQELLQASAIRLVIHLRRWTQLRLIRLGMLRIVRVARIRFPSLIHLPHPRRSLLKSLGGVDTVSPLDQHSTTVSGSLSPGTTTLTSNSITPSVNGALVMGYGNSQGSSQTITSGTGFTNFITNSGSAGNGMQSNIQTTATAVTSAMTFNTAGGTGQVNIASFKPAASVVVVSDDTGHLYGGW